MPLSRPLSLSALSRSEQVRALRRLLSRSRVIDADIPPPEAVQHQAGHEHRFVRHVGRSEERAATAEHTHATSEDSQYTTKSFSSLQLTPKTLQALEHEFRYKTMSAVQEQVLSRMPIESDLLVRAKTGTGKTLAFLIAALEIVITRFKSRPAGVPILILSPTRELAMQIAREAERLVKNRRWNVVCAVGGESRSRNIRMINNSSCDILVATPGRLNDLLASVPSVRSELEGLKVLIFDEADVLLEMGFRKEIESINHNLPSQRQTFLFSATITREVRSIARETLRDGFVSVDTVPANESDMHQKISQSYVIVPYSQQLAMLHDVITEHRKSNPLAKVLVFFNTTKGTRFFSETFNRLDDMDVLEIHSGLTQAGRSRVAERFRSARSAVLFTSDVSARGVDYPGVTLVVQVGCPNSREQYVHRIGRTGRAGKEGEAVILLSSFEEPFLELLEQGSIRKNERHVAYSGPRPDNIQQRLSAIVSKADQYERRETYLSQLGAFIGQSSLLGIRKDTAYKASVQYAQGVLGFDEAPELPHSLATNLGLTRVRDVRLSGVSHRRDHDDDIGRSRGMFGRRTSGGRDEGHSRGGDLAAGQANMSRPSDRASVKSHE
ncbi:hypothetical protein HK105_202268 [Polyrhizophydium stewartii]|uniref:ATP-dependent RNA helicase n=1 Tax=Polyrhizophydium stewartii TaxID=2732419 RepID=A0ABR4NFR3_9FUNG